MKYLTIFALTAAMNANALVCSTDADCTSAALSLIKAATKLKACDKEKEAVARAIKLVANPNDNTIAELELCVQRAKNNAKLTKRAAKRLERIQKAMISVK